MQVPLLTPLLTLNVPPVQLQAKQSFSVLIVETTALRGISAHCKLAACVFPKISSARKAVVRWSSAKKDNDGMPLV